MKARNNIILVSAFIAVLGPTSLLALSSDADQPIEIEADFAELDEQEGKTVYTGNVIVTQGSIRMTGDILRVNLDDNNELEHVFLEGQPAVFRQRPDNSEDDIVGRARLIEYHSKQNLLSLVDDARVTRGNELFEGHQISYDTERSIITARSQSAGERRAAGDSSETSGGRVRIVIPPRKND